MVPVTTNIAEMLKSFSDVLPVNRLSKPTVFEDLERVVFPVLSFDPAPLASRLLRLEMFLLSQTLVGADVNVSFNTPAVPRGEVHRYYDISIQQGGSTNRKFQLKETYEVASGGGVGIGIIALMDVKKDRPQNLLGLYTSAGPDPMSWSGVPLDMYPGSFWQINNEENLDVLITVILSGVRLVLRGPDITNGQDVSDEIFSSST